MATTWASRVSPQDLPPGTAVVGAGAQERLDAVVSVCAAGNFDALRFALFDASASVRHLAITCWDVDVAGLDVLRPLVDDSDRSVRIGLADTLGRAAAPAAQDLLWEIIGDPDPRVRATALSGLRLEEMDRPVAPVMRLLRDRDLLVSAAAAEAIERSGLAERVPAALREDFELARAAAELRPQLPEIFAAAAAIEDRLVEVARLVERAGPYEGACAEPLLATLEGADDHVRELLRDIEGEKRPDRLAEALDFERSLARQIQAYHTCLSATPLPFDSVGMTDPFAGDWLLLTGEVSTAWETRFGLLRADLESPPEGGELWAEARVGLDAFFPNRPAGFLVPLDEPSLDLSARLRRDQLFRHDELSGWAGGALARGQAPFACGSFAFCRLGGSFFGERSTGEEADFPTRLVAAHHQLTGDAWLRVPLRQSLATLTIDVGRTRYRRDALAPAGLDTAGVQLAVDAPFQLQTGVRRNLYARPGPTEGRTPQNAGVERDGTIVSTLLGVRFGQPSPEGTLQLSVLGGIDFPLYDELDEELEPQITFQTMLSTQSGTQGGDLSRLRIGGRRAVEASPRDFAIQTATGSLIEYVYQSVTPPESGIRIDLRLTYDLVQHLVPLTAVEELEISVIRGLVGVRVLVAEWLGFSLTNELSATSSTGRDFDLNNRFFLAMFLPLGHYNFGLAEDLPW